MSHNVYTEIYDENVNKKNVQNFWDEKAARDDYEEGCSGLSQNIRWINYLCENEEEAEKYIKENDSGWYDQLAVKFKCYKNIKPSKALMELIRREKETVEKLNYTENNIHYKNVKSSFVSCKKCGSKLATKYIKSNYCPMCNDDLRPNTTLSTIQRYKENLKEIRKRIKEENLKIQKKNEKSATIKWLVKIEYHT